MTYAYLLLSELNKYSKVIKLQNMENVFTSVRFLFSFFLFGWLIALCLIFIELLSVFFIVVEFVVIFIILVIFEFALVDNLVSLFILSVYDLNLFYA